MCRIFQQCRLNIPEVDSLEAFAVKQDEVVMEAFKESFNGALL